MQIGLFYAGVWHASVVELLSELRKYPRIRMLEIGTGGRLGSGISM